MFVVAINIPGKTARYAGLSSSFITYKARGIKPSLKTSLKVVDSKREALVLAAKDLAEEVVTYLREKAKGLEVEVKVVKISSRGDAMDALIRGCSLAEYFEETLENVPRDSEGYALELPWLKKVAEARRLASMVEYPQGRDSEDPTVKLTFGDGSTLVIENTFQRVYPGHAYTPIGH